MSAPFSDDYLSENKGPEVLAIIIVFPILASITVFLRLYTRFKIVNNPSWDDFSIFLALILSVATSICQGLQVYYGMGRHFQALTLEQGIGAQKGLFASILVYNFGLTFVKVSIILQYLRIAVARAVRIGCYAFLAFVVAYGIETFFSGLFTCVPVSKFWNAATPGRCINDDALYFANAGINIFQDFCLIIFPVFILRKLVLPRREKISLVLILGLGGFASITSILRLHAIYVVSVSKDISWDSPGTATWSAMELNIGIICASLPTLRALLAKFFPGTFRSSISGAGYHNTSSRRRCVGDSEFGMAQNGGTIAIHTELDIQRNKDNLSPATTASDSDQGQRGY